MTEQEALAYARRDIADTTFLIEKLIVTLRKAGALADDVSEEVQVATTLNLLDTAFSENGIILVAAVAVQRLAKLEPVGE